jgi:hypothetical protein
MGKRTIQECDFCKEEYDPDNTHQLTFKKPGKRVGNKFELCGACASKIQQQLVSDKPLPKEKDVSSRRQELNEVAEDHDDDVFVRQKKQELKDRNGDDHVVETTVSHEDDGKCIHRNKGRVTMGEIGNGQKGWFHRCKDCGTKLPVHSAEEKAAYMNAKAPAGTREGYR